MDLNKSRVKDLAVGDLVTHVLYGKEWVGMILGFKEEQNDSLPLSARNEKALVQIQPGTKYEGFFKDRVTSENRINDNLGCVTTNWLFKIEIKDEKVRPSRNKTRKGGK